MDRVRLDGTDFPAPARALSVLRGVISDVLKRKKIRMYSPV